MFIRFPISIDPDYWGGGRTTSQCRALAKHAANVLQRWALIHHPEHDIRVVVVAGSYEHSQRHRGEWQPEILHVLDRMLVEMTGLDTG